MITRMLDGSHPSTPASRAPTAGGGNDAIISYDHAFAITVPLRNARGVTDLPCVFIPVFHATLNSRSDR